MVIKPVPHGLINDESSNGGAHHIVYKRKVDTTEQFGDFGKTIYKIYVHTYLYLDSAMPPLLKQD